MPKSETSEKSCKARVAVRSVSRAHFKVYRGREGFTQRSNRRSRNVSTKLGAHNHVTPKPASKAKTNSAILKAQRVDGQD